MCGTAAIHFQVIERLCLSWSTSVFKSIIDKLILLFLSACLSNTEIGRFFQGEIEFPVYFFLLPTFDVNLFRLNSTFPHFDSKHIPFPAPDGECRRRERQTAQVLASTFIYCIAIIIFTLPNTGHIKITKCPIIVTEKQSCRLSWSNSLAGLSSRVLQLRGIILAVIFSLLPHRRNFTDGF